MIIKKPVYQPNKGGKKKEKEVISHRLIRIKKNGR